VAQATTKEASPIVNKITKNFLILFKFIFISQRYIFLAGNKKEIGLATYYILPQTH
jgi:hypothetical protein